MHPAHRKFPQALCAGDKKRVWNVRAEGTVNGTPRRVLGSPGGIVLPPSYSCLSRQGQLACGDRGTHRRRRCKSALHRGRETGP